jgi:hypothetical protein
MKVTGGASETTSAASRTEKPYVWELDVDGIATFRMLTAATFTLELAQATIADLMALTGGKRTPILVDVRRSKGITREARTFLGNQTGSYSALAMLAGSPATQMIANFFIGLNRPSVPTQVFTDEEQARTWLRRYGV